MDWRQFTMNLDSLQADEVEQVFARHGALSVTLTDAGDDPVLEPAPGATPLWANTRISALFNADVDLLSLREDLLQSFELDDLPENLIEDIEERAWEREWLKDFRPMQFGQRLWVCPHGQSPDADDAIVVSLDPGLAFGTGTHQTTALCLEWLDGIDVADQRILDFGCGSGILAIAALKLGANSVDGTDIDPQAIVASNDNAERNGVREGLNVSTDASEFPGPYDIVLANILAGTLVELADELVQKLAPGGRIALSGILSEQIPEVSQAYVDSITLDEPVLRDNWALLTGTKR